MGIRRREEGSPRVVGGLVSMLVRYPEIGMVKYDPRQQTIRFSLLISDRLTDEEFERLHVVLSDTLDVYNRLDQRRTHVLEIIREHLGELTVIALTRDVGSLTPGEVWTIVEFCRDWFSGRLVAEGLEFQGEDEMLAQDEMIEQILSELQGTRPGRDLIAIREDGRVMVFQK